MVLQNMSFNSNHKSYNSIFISCNFEYYYVIIKTNIVILFIMNNYIRQYYTLCIKFDVFGIFCVIFNPHTVRYHFI